MNELIQNAKFSGEISLLFIDIDGNDFGLWKATHVNNLKVIVETQNEFG